MPNWDLEISDGKFHVIVQGASAWIAYDNPLLGAMLADLKEASAVTDFDVFEAPLKPGTNDTYLYLFDAENGRDYAAEIVVPVQGEASIEFHLTGFWTMTELVPQRPLRDATIVFLKEFRPSVLRVTYTH